MKPAVKRPRKLPFDGGDSEVVAVIGDPGEPVVATPGKPVP